MRGLSPPNCAYARCSPKYFTEPTCFSFGFFGCSYVLGLEYSFLINIILKTEVQYHIVTNKANFENIF
jgi:hypothetical protein